MFTRIYALAVCFASILCIAISTGIGLYDVLQITFPKLAMDSYLYQNLQSNEAYRQSHLYFNRGHTYPGFNIQAGSGIARALSVPETLDRSDRGEPMSDEEISKRRLQQLDLAMDNVRHDAQRSLLQILVILLVSIPLFVIHWRFAQKLDARKST